VDAARDEAVVEATRQKALAQAEIEASANRAREELRRQVSLLAVSGAEKLLQREIDANAHKALLDELAAEIRHEPGADPRTTLCPRRVRRGPRCRRPGGLVAGPGVSGAGRCRTP